MVVRPPQVVLVLRYLQSLHGCTTAQLLHTERGQIRVVTGQVGCPTVQLLHTERGYIRVVTGQVGCPTVQLLHTERILGSSRDRLVVLDTAHLMYR